MRGGKHMKGVTLEVAESVQTDAHDEIEIRCECREGRSEITLTIPKFQQTAALHFTLTDNEFDQVTAVVEDFRKKRAALASNYTND